MRPRHFGFVVLAGVLLVGAKECSESDQCKAAKAARDTVCSAAPDSDSCKAAKQTADELCKVKPTPTPEPTPTPTPTPTPEPTCPEACPAGTACTDPAKGCQPVPGPTPEPPAPPAQPFLVDEDLVGYSETPMRKLTWNATWVALVRDKADHPSKYTKDGMCLADGAAGIDATYERLSGYLGTSDIVAAQSMTKGGKRSDCIFVNRAGTRLYEETHLFEYGRGCHATGPNAIKSVWEMVGAVGDACPAQPCPARVFADTGAPHWHWNAKQHTMGNGDSTPVVDKACDYCRKVGLGDSGTPGVPRCGCPVRPDGHPDRMKVEAWLLEGRAVRDGRNGQDCTPNNTDNPMAFLWGTGNCRMCNAPKTVCSGWF